MTRYDATQRVIRIAVLAVMVAWVLMACGSSEIVIVTNRNNGDITQSPTTISYTVDGAVDERNYLWPSNPPEKRFVSSVKIINVGNQAIKNPRVRINGFLLPLTTQEFLEGVTLNGADAQDRLLNLYYTMINYTIHGGELPLDDVTPLSWFLGHGYGFCEVRTAVQAAFWDVMGHRWKNAMASNHTTGEVEILDRTAVLDTDQIGFFLMHDNWTIASSQDIRDDSMLVLRSAPYRTYNRSPRLAGEPEVNMWYSSEKVASLYSNRYDIPFEANPLVWDSFELHLRPGEAYGWHTDKSAHLDPDIWKSIIDTVAREMTWETNLDFGNPSHLWGIAGSGRTIVQNPSGSAVIDADMPVRLFYNHPFPIIGAELTVRLGNAAASDTLMRIKITGSPGDPVILDIPLNTLAAGFVSLDDRIQSLPYPQRKMTIEMWPVGPEAAVTRSVALKGISLKLFCQSTAFAFRGLRAGKNELIYSDASGSRSVRVEVQTVPANVQLLRYSQGEFLPAANQEIAESNLVFSWPEAEGAPVSGYHWQLSAFEDMRYPLSPTFDRLIEGDQIKRSGGRVNFTLPWRGMLPINRTLYWRVRPFGTDRWAGAWSAARPFKVRGPVAPEQVRATYTGGKIELSWSPRVAGSRPVLYEIHHSSLEGFSPVSENHRILGFSDQPVIKYVWEDVTATDWPVVPSTLLTTTSESRYILHDPANPQTNLPNPLGAHIRIIAVDSEGSRSAPSPQISLTAPYLCAPAIVSLPAGEVSWKVPVIITAGRVTATEPYYMGLWGKPQYTFSLGNISGGNGNWGIDAQTGTIQGTLSNGGNVSMTVDVTDQYGNQSSRQIGFVGL
ncbi:MAG: hypothetical protein FJZ87_06865 [Chloroflexi bacterium]|nr:hypothetical protein [Chloroflexota bacterium]